MDKVYKDKVYKKEAGPEYLKTYKMTEILKTSVFCNISVYVPTWFINKNTGTCI